MSKLDDFLGLGNVEDIREEIKVRVQGKEYSLTIRAMTGEEHADFQKRSNVITKKSVSFDLGKYNSLVLPACIVEPNFSDAKFLEQVKCQTAWEFLSKKFPAGVLVDIGQKIQELSGFESLDMEVEEAKN